jgi:hypothetical protein
MTFKKYLIKLLDGSERIIFSEKYYFIGDWYNSESMIISILND